MKVSRQHTVVVTGGALGILKQVQPSELTFIQRFIVSAHVLVEWSIGCNERALECSQGFGRVGERYRFVILREMLLQSTGGSRNAVVGEQFRPGSCPFHGV